METDLICIVCNDIFPDSSKLCKHHQALHSKQELSRALLHLQVLLKQCQAAFKRFNQDKLDDGNATKNKINKRKQHKFYNIMRVNDVNMLFETSANVEATDMHRKRCCTDDQTSYHDDIYLVRIYIPFSETLFVKYVHTKTK